MDEDEDEESRTEAQKRNMSNDDGTAAEMTSKMNEGDQEDEENKLGNNEEENSASGYGSDGSRDF